MKILRLFLYILLATVTASAAPGPAADSARQKTVLHAQNLLNLPPAGANVTDSLRDIVDALGRNGNFDDYYFAAENLLIDQLFRSNRFKEADNAALRMEEEARRKGMRTAMAMSHRVRGQMFYKLSQPRRAMAELDTALRLTPDFRESLNAFTTYASINEWRVIAGRAVADTAVVGDARRRYIRAVRHWSEHGWSEPTAHFAVTALAFAADETARDNACAVALLDSAEAMIVPQLPARVYEHYHRARAMAEAARGNFDRALESANLLLSTHANYPWFYMEDLRLRADLLRRAGRHDSSIADYARYAAMRDSLSSEQIGHQLADLTTLYHTELEAEHRRASLYRIVGLCGVSLLLLILLIVSLRAAHRQRRHNRLLVEHLRELDSRLAAAEKPAEAPTAAPQQQQPSSPQESLIARLDRYKAPEQPYVNPALGRQELARAMQVSPDAVARSIRDARDLSVLAYINSHRLDHARRVLESDSTETLTEIAARLGFGTLRTFQRTFSDRFSMPPSRYRSLARKN